MALSFAQITAITNNHIIPKVVDNIYNGHPFLARLSRKGFKMVLDGGVKIQAPISSSKPNQGGYYKDLDTLNTDRTDNITAAKILAA